MCGLIVKCAALIVLIHAFRALGRLAGPRFSGLALGLPSTTAVVLIFCGCERGGGAATEMAESGLLGLVAALALPLAYIGSVRRGWPLVGCDRGVGGRIHRRGGRVGQRTGDRRTAAGRAGPDRALGAAVWVGGDRCRAAGEDHARVPLSKLRTMFLRTATPALYVVALGLAEYLAGASWAGLVSTFPSMSLVVLMVTHLEAGGVEAGRIAQVLPSGNISTLAFLAVFRLVCTDVGVGWATVAGYGGALGVLVVIQAVTGRSTRIGPLVSGVHLGRRVGHVVWRSGVAAFPWPRGLHLRLAGTQARGGSRDHARRRLAHRCGFAPLVETIAW